MRTLLLLAALTCLAGVAAGAAEPKGVFLERPDGIYDPAGRVDPFTLGPARGDPVPDPNDPWREVKRKLADLRPEVRLDGVAELLTSPAGDAFERCLAECAKLLPALRSPVDYLREHPEADDGTLARCRELIEKCGRLEATARRLKERRDIEKEFAGLRLRVTGIVTRAGQAAAAAVEGRVVREGDRLTPSAAPDRIATVRRIEPQAVTFVYRGVEVTLALE